MAFFDVDDADAHADLRSHRVHRPQRLRWPRRRQCRARGFRARSGPALDPCAALQVPFELAGATGARSDVSARRGTRHADDARSLGAALPRQRGGAGGARRRAPAMAADAGRRAGGNARRGAQRAGQRLAAVPDARVPPVGAQRLLPIRRRVRIPRPVAGRHGAGACRAAADARALLLCAQRASSSKATCSTGGIRRPGAACARIARTITCGCRWPTARYVHAPATPACWTSRSRSSKGRRVNPGRRFVLRPARPLRAKSASLYDHCVRAIMHGLRFGSTACR